MKKIYLIAILILLESCISALSSKKNIPLSTYLEKKIHLLVNRERKKRGLKPLKWDKKLAKIAREHSEDMARNNYFSHINKKGEGPDERALRHHYKIERSKNGYILIGLGENIFKTYTFSHYYVYPSDKRTYIYKTTEAIASEIIEGWMHSKGHRKNILNANFEKEGIGVFITEDGEIYVTQDFF